MKKIPNWVSGGLIGLITGVALVANLGHCGSQKTEHHTNPLEGLIDQCTAPHCWESKDWTVICEHIECKDEK